MTVNQNQSTSDDELDSDSVERYLLKHTEFFRTRPDLLTQLSLPHQSGAAVSLIERQIDLLRDKNKRLENQLHQLIDIARDNDRFNEQLQRLTLCLMEVDDLNEALVLLTTVLEKDFDAEVIVLHIMADPAAFAIDRSGFRFMDIQYIDHDSPAVASYNSIISRSDATCGRLTNEQRVLMFSHRADEVMSAALVPLGFRMSYAPEKPALGLLAIGSKDPERFHYDMGTVFLKYLGELIARILSPHVVE